MSFKVLTTVEQKLHIINEDTGEHVTVNTPDEVEQFIKDYNSNAEAKAKEAEEAKVAAAGPVAMPNIPTMAVPVEVGTDAVGPVAVGEQPVVSKYNPDTGEINPDYVEPETEPEPVTNVN